MIISIGLMMFPVLMIFIFIGFPVAFSLMGVAVLFGYLRFGDLLVHQLVAKVDDVASYYVSVSYTHLTLPTIYSV